MEQAVREGLCTEIDKHRSNPLEKDYRLGEHGSNPFEREQRIPEQGTNRSKETGELENKEQTARKRLDNLRTRSKKGKGTRVFQKRGKPL